MKEPNLKERVEEILDLPKINVNDLAVHGPYAEEILKSGNKKIEALLALIQEDRKEIVERLRNSMYEAGTKMLRELEEPGNQREADGINCVVTAFDLEAARVMEK